MKKMLMLASVASMIDQFNIPNIELLQEMGYSVDVACNFQKGNTCSIERITEFKKKLKNMGVSCYQIDFARNIINLFSNFKALWQVEAIMKRNQYDFVHCHSPIGGVIGRLAGKRTHTKVIYTAHGFHFYKGAPLINWLLYYPIEKCLAKFTDVLLTINKEDYQRAKQKFNSGNVYYIPGIGIDIDKFQTNLLNINLYKNNMGISQDSFILLSVGELNKNKNHSIVIKALGMLKEQKSIHYIIAGEGKLKEELSELAHRCGVEKQVHLLGYRKDIAEILQIADIYILPSYREGLNVSLMEAMASGLPCIVSDIRGNRDLIDEEGGILCESSSEHDFANAIRILKNDSEKREKLGCYNKNKIRNFTIETVGKRMESIYLLSNIKKGVLSKDN